MVFAEICLFLDVRTVFCEAVVVCKDWMMLVNTNEFRRYWLKRHFGIEVNLGYQRLMEIYKRTKKNKILGFEGWMTDAGASPMEFANDFRNMWRYNGCTYSTLYSTTEVRPLARNANCLGLFSGGYQKKAEFFNEFHNDLFQVFLNFHNVPEMYKSEDYINHKCLIIDPLGRHANINIDAVASLLDFEPNLNNSDAMEVNLRFNPGISEDIAVVTKIAIARPFYYTGAVKNLVFLASERYYDIQFEEFVKFNNLGNFEVAINAAKVKRVFHNDEFIVIEYEKGEGFYPLIWVEFLKIDSNHLVFELAQAHFIKCVNVKLFDIDDRRIDYDLSNFQPNFDITYALMIGSILNSQDLQ